MTPPYAQSLWIGSSLSKVEQLSLASFIANGMPFVLYVYQDVKNVPDGVEIKDANTILDESKVFKHVKGSFAPFSDLFRISLLQQTDGYWVDTDMVCLKPFDFSQENVFGLESDDKANTAVLRLANNDSLLTTMSEYCSHPSKLQPYDSRRTARNKIKRKLQFKNQYRNVRFGETGPELITSILKHQQRFDEALPFSAFYPIHHSSAAAMFSKGSQQLNALLENSYAVHLWNEVLRKRGVDKNAGFEPDSLVGSLAKRFL
ncbi:glycosyltransferase [Aliagarivorans marinus]|uniref:glycosyltransferase n=1 Tax=Aliagarivorans marinus TaxID=561965 RepID=UPI00047CFEF1|nr:glycosyltransferase [Aliagarivorans marinus]